MQQILAILFVLVTLQSYLSLSLLGVSVRNMNTTREGEKKIYNKHTITIII
jgi:hypothetical protein